MTGRRDVHHAIRIARAEVIRELRGATGDRRRVIGLLMVGLFYGSGLLFALPAVYALGQATGTVQSIPYLGGIATVAPVSMVVLSIFRTSQQIGTIDSEELVLLTVHPRAVVLGVIGAEVVQSMLWFGVPIGLIATAFALGIGAPTLPVTAGLVLLPLFCWATVWGYAGGIGMLRLFRWLPGLKQLLKIGWALALLPIIVGSQYIGTAIADRTFSIAGLLETLAFEPLQSYVELAFVGTELFHSPSIGAIGVLGGLVALTPVGLAVATRQATTFWFTDDPAPEQPQRTERSVGGFEAPQPFGSTSAGAIAWGHLVRAVRQPQEFAHLMIMLVMLGPAVAPIVQVDGNVGPIVAAIGVVVGTYLAGAAFGLNPLGDDRPAFPLLLLTEAGPRTLVWSRVIAGLAIGAPIAFLIPLGSIVAGTPALFAVGFAVVGCGMCLTAAMFAVGIGAVYPIYEEQEYWGTETVVPSTGIMMVYFWVVAGGTVIGLILTWVVLTGAGSLSLLIAAGVGVYLLLTALVPYGSYRYAIRRYRTYTLE
ncbi:hypothetical protein [Halocatena pleomorpha]|uniref:ABC-2 type transport system permease protein n=1 Tax=Halocatena pleomorpha TaxID=1785090 RepID=A0A3P3RH31_9EURY|nr:hypothetical protein [Halocatena pleomorpha]RRJ32695.1 hypothetical protein EIK79_04360 [Halocatena pleomorpha]